MNTEDTSRISISAHYTGYVWYKNGLSSSQFVTPMGRLANTLIAPMNRVMKTIAGAHMDTFLLQRHLLLDLLLKRLIEEQGVEQVVELACGLSPRGYRLSQRYPHISYLETDLPGMAKRKAELLQGLNRPARHGVRSCNILAEQGDESLTTLLAQLDPQKKTVVLSEGLVNYFELVTIRQVWARLVAALQPFPAGYYLTDLYPDLIEHPNYKYVKLTSKLVGRLTGGDWPLHYRNDQAIQEGFLQDGFSDVKVEDPANYYQQLGLPKLKQATLVRIIQAKA